MKQYLEIKQRQPVMEFNGSIRICIMRYLNKQEVLKTFQLAVMINKICILWQFALIKPILNQQSVRKIYIMEVIATKMKQLMLFFTILGRIINDYFFCLFLSQNFKQLMNCLLYTSPSPRDRQKSRMPSSA
eukprot:TRINITY_DN11805_c0_g1_i1.p2 TRINITY_DN11805_c0_g1~~TRINITY_DN11805_c0_g1_i1.p2  ORF type:complete len:131 (-),score=18.47 TRINITY_DN11805_c0_g1_i1:56-448(-)